MFLSTTKRGWWRANSKGAKRPGEINEGLTLSPPFRFLEVLSESSALTCSAAVRMAAGKPCWKDLGWRVLHSFLEHETAIYLMAYSHHSSHSLRCKIFTIFFWRKVISWCSTGVEGGIKGILSMPSLIASFSKQEEGVWLGKSICSSCLFPLTSPSFRDHRKGVSMSPDCAD